MKLLAAALVCLLLAHVAQAGMLSWGWGLDGYRDARSNYHEMMANCELEGGECIDVDFNTGVIGGGRSGGSGEEANGGGRRRPARAGRPGRRGAAARRYQPRPAPKPVDPQEILNYLYSECRSWEFDFGCHRKGNICCY